MEASRGVEVERRMRDSRSDSMSRRRRTSLGWERRVVMMERFGEGVKRRCWLEGGGGKGDVDDDEDVGVEEGGRGRSEARSVSVMSRSPMTTRPSEGPCGWAEIGRVGEDEVTVGSGG
jgi:hypothetical protein